MFIFISVSPFLIVIKESVGLLRAESASAEIGGQPEFPAYLARTIDTEHVQIVEITRN